MHKEYGGYLPLELRHGGEYFEKSDGVEIFRTNSGRTSIYLAAKAMNCSKIFVPYYICDTVIGALHKEGIEIKRFFIDDLFSIPDIDNNDNEAILIVNYFGLMDKQIADYADSHRNLIIDNTQAFFCKPFLREDVFNVYSARKFVGTADGGYIIGMKHISADISKDLSYKHIEHIICQYEMGTNAEYGASVQNERRVGNEVLEMSDFTLAVLRNADYEYIKERRFKNYECLNERLADFNALDIGKANGIPYLYPFLADKDLISEMVSRKIYTPRLWKELLRDEFNGRAEFVLSSNLLCLPLDQRYDQDDMEYVADTVRQLL